MKRFAIYWRGRARRQYDAQIDYIAQDSPKNAENMHRRVETALNLIRSNPRLTPVSMRISGCRQLRIGKLLLFYKVYEEHVEIVSVKHGAQNF